MHTAFLCSAFGGKVFGLIYTSDKLRELKNQITSSYGKTVATRIVSKIMSEIRGLQENPKKGPSVFGSKSVEFKNSHYGSDCVKTLQMDKLWYNYGIIIPRRKNVCRLFRSKI